MLSPLSWDGIPTDGMSRQGHTVNPLDNRRRGYMALRLSGPHFQLSIFLGWQALGAPPMSSGLIRCNQSEGLVITDNRKLQPISPCGKNYISCFVHMPQFIKKKQRQLKKISQRGI